MDFFDLLANSQAFLISTLFFLGLIIGSFLNVVIHRLPIMLEREWGRDCRDFLQLPDDDQINGPYNLLRPASSCPSCGHKIRAWENIPVISWLMLRGRCSACQAKISARYPIIELITGLFSAWMAWHFGYGLVLLGSLLFIWLLISMTVIDLDRQLLPDLLTLSGLWIGLLFNLEGTFTDLRSAVIGAIAGYMGLWIIVQLHKTLTGRQGMGNGDFKLLAMLGAWMGWQALPGIILLSSVVGAVVGIAIIVLRRQDRQTPIPFGPYLAGAGLIYLLWGKDLTQAYLQMSGLA